MVAVRPDVGDHLVGILAGLLGLLANERFDVVVGDLDAGALSDRFERELAGDRLRGLGAQLARQELRRLARCHEVRLGRDPAPSERADEAVQQLPGAGFDERPRSDDTRLGDEPVDGGRAVCRVDLLLERDADAAFDVAAQLSERVELARGARQLVVDRGQHLLADDLTVTSTAVVHRRRARR